MGKRVVQSLVGFAISAALVVWLYYAIEWREVGKQIIGLNYWMLLPVTALMLLHYYLRAWRWRFLLPREERAPSIQALFDSIIVGTFASFILPLRAGEFVRPYILTRRSSTPFSTGFASVVIERFFDLSMVLFTFALVMYQVPTMPDWVQKGAVLLSILALAIFIFIVVGSLLPNFIIKVCNLCFSCLPTTFANKLIVFVKQILSAAQVVSNPANLLRVILLTVLVWISCYFITHAVFLMFPIEPTFLMSVTVSVIIALAVAAPSAPGFIGVYQTAGIAGVQLFALSKELGASYSIISHVYQYLFFTLLSVAFFARSGIAFSDITRVKKD